MFRHVMLAGSISGLGLLTALLCYYYVKQNIGRDRFISPRLPTATKWRSIHDTTVNEGLDWDRELQLSSLTANKSDTGENLSSVWDREQSHRRDCVRSFCDVIASTGQLPHQGSLEAYKLNADLKRGQRLLADTRHKVLYCSVPKAATSSWMAVFQRLNTPESKTKPDLSRTPMAMQSFGVLSRGYLQMEDFKFAVSHYTSFLVVRHPLERLLSAYMNKFTSDRQNELKHRYAPQMLYRNKTNHVRGRHVTFAEFLGFISDNTIPEMERMDEHWETYQNLCNPCVIKYDHILKMESLATDTVHMLDRYFDGQRNILPQLNEGKLPTASRLDKYYKHIPKDTMKKLYRQYKTDMFGYPQDPKYL